MRTPGAGCKFNQLASNVVLKHNLDMRTTVTLDDDVATIAAQYAQSRELSLSKAIADLIARGTRKAPRIQ